MSRLSSPVSVIRNDEAKGKTKDGHRRDGMEFDKVHANIRRDRSSVSNAISKQTSLKTKAKSRKCQSRWLIAAPEQTTSSVDRSVPKPIPLAAVLQLPRTSPAIRINLYLNVIICNSGLNKFRVEQTVAFLLPSWKATVECEERRKHAHF